MSPWSPRQAGAAHVIVVCGPPASGKTTYALGHMERGDLIVDMDALFVALSGLEPRDKPDGLLPFVAAARDAVVDRLRRAASVKTAFIITTDAAEAQRLTDRFRAELIELSVDESERRRRLAERRRA